MTEFSKGRDGGSYHGHDARPVVELKEYTFGKSGRVDLHHKEIIFVIKGAMHIAVDSGGGEQRKLEAWECVFMPPGTTLSCLVENNSSILIIRITKEYPEGNILNIKLSGHLRSRPEGIYALRANEIMRHYLGGLIHALKDGMVCRDYMQLKVGEMLFLLNAYYPVEERIWFLSSVISPDTGFSEFVRMNWGKYMSAKELSDAMNIPLQQFLIRFRKVFGTSSRKWIQQQKARQIYNDLCRSDKELKVIAMENKLTTTSLNRYCKNKFGLSPGMLRGSVKVDVDEMGVAARNGDVASGTGSADQPFPVEVAPLYSPLWYSMMSMKMFCKGDRGLSCALYDMGQDVMRMTGSEFKPLLSIHYPAEGKGAATAGSPERVAN